MKEKVAAIKDFPTPCDVKQRQFFVGLASDLQKFGPAFASFIAPLMHLLRNTSVTQAL